VSEYRITSSEVREFGMLPVPPEGPSASTVRVCIATTEFAGLTATGGVGTAYTGLAGALADAGHQVSVLFASGPARTATPFADWVAHYEKRGIRLVALPTLAQDVGSRYQNVAYATYRWLREHQDEFDVVHVPECAGTGYYALAAKKAGIAFANTCFCVGIHGGSTWAKQVNGEPFWDVSDLELDFMEQQSVALADVAVSPSRYLLRWRTERGLPHPANTYVQPNIIPPSATPGTPDRGAHPKRIDEFVFFGRLEYRKGLTLFCDALDMLADRGAGGFRVTFLGRSGTVLGREGTAYIRDRAARWSSSVQVLTECDQPEALAYLRGETRLAVMPSLSDNLPCTVLECVESAVPFVATHTGGIPEMVAVEDRSRVLVEPNAVALADRLSRVLAEGMAPAAPAVKHEENAARWLAWHASAKPTVEDAAKPMAERPPVNVCPVHGPMAEATIASIQAQDYPNVEAPSADTGTYLLVLDDGVCVEPNALSSLVQAAEHWEADVVTACVAVGKGQTFVPLGPAVGVGAFRNCFGEGLALFRLDAFRELGGLPEKGTGVSSLWELLAKAAIQGRPFGILPETVGRRKVAERDRPAGACPRCYLESVPQSLRGVLELAAALQAGMAHTRAELSRYEASYRHFTGLAPVRALRAVKRLLGRLFGRREAESTR